MNDHYGLSLLAFIAVLLVVILWYIVAYAT